MDRGGTTLREVDVSEEGGLIRVPLTEGALLFDLMTEGKTLAIKVSVVVENGLTTTLINETVQLTHKGASSSQSTRHTVAIITPVAAVMVIFVLAIFILVVVWYKRCRTQQQFEFKPMTVTYSDMKAQAGAEEGELEGTTEKDGVGNEYEEEKDAVGNEYEAEKDAVGNEYEEVDSKPLTSQQPSDA
jgi:flagellar biosynthesis/type III secretory pathway M-ring protein FliF/YscJ